MAQITPFLWFDGHLAEAIAFYTRVFGDSAVLSTTPYPPSPTGDPQGLMTATFRLANQDFVALSGDSPFHFSPAISFFISCSDQPEIDHYWDALIEGGQAMRCGWLTDQFGLTWQVVPATLGTLLSDPDPERAGRVTAAMLEMVKLDIAVLEAAHAA
jgi:predicted 3-demethylubiquinone-9 3-methyltransferase (glyoxalase superfamily)